MRASYFAALSLASVVTGCEPDDPETIDPIYPADWKSTYIEVRGCRGSPDHDLEFVGLWIDPASQARFDECVKPGGTCTGAFDAGATFVKPQYSDPACTDLVRVSAARKEAGFDAVGGWRWQEVAYTGGKAKVTEDGALQQCYGCHASSACEDAFDTRCYMDADL